MGVPSFYRWLVSKYQKVVVRAVDEEEPNVDDYSSWWEATSSSPTNGPFDNLYLDMNGIIHPCFHPEDQLFPPTTEDEVFAAMFRYIDRIIRVVRPRKLVYMAIDGVAPRAKMNQQRSRRFRAAKDAELADAEEERLRREFQRKGKPVLPKAETQLGDSNVITPGTAFMARLSRALEYYIRSRLNHHPGWKNLKIILSDANVPGEGEHKIMAFIRLQRNLPGYDPNTRHCLYGLDADLIFLALATHELNISILREDVLTQTTPDISSALEGSLSAPVHERLKSNPCVQKAIARKGGMKPLQFLNIWTLREYLEQEFTIPDAPITIDIERIVDDFVFMSFFTGNDFLPHLPSLEIHENALDLLIHVYKSEFKKMGGYLVDTTRLNEKKAAFVEAKRVEIFVQAVATYETKIFIKRYNMLQAKLKRIMRQQIEERENEACNIEFLLSEDEEHSVAGSNSEATESTVFMLEKCNTRSEISEEQRAESVLANTKELIVSLKKYLRDKGDLFKHEIPGSDKIMLGHPGGEERYYSEKFSLVSLSEIQLKKKEVVQKYTEGLCWTLIYYYSGVASWQWYYPFHYAPFALDLKGMPWSSVSFNLGEPIKPLEQLLSVLPQRSAPALPEVYSRLMTTKESALAKYYRKDFEVDLHGKRFLWQGIVKLYFIDEGLLVAEARKLEKELEDDESARNSFRNDKILMLRFHNLASQIGSGSSDSRVKFCVDGMNGYLCSNADMIGGEVTQRSDFPSPIVGMEDIQEDDSVCSEYMNPDPHDHFPKLLKGTEIPEMTITASDIEWRPLWHEHHGSNPRAGFVAAASHHGNRGTFAGHTTGQPGCSTSIIGRAGPGAWRGRGRDLAATRGSNIRPAGPGAWRGRGRGRGRDLAATSGSNIRPAGPGTLERQR